MGLRVCELDAREAGAVVGWLTGTPIGSSVVGCPKAVVFAVVVVKAVVVSEMS